MNGRIMRYSSILFYLIVIFASSVVTGDSLEGRVRLVVRTHANQTPEFFEPERTPEQSVLGLDISAGEVEHKGATLVLGKTHKDGKRELVVARYLPNYIPDRYFGGDGA